MIKQRRNGWKASQRLKISGKQRKPEHSEKTDGPSHLPTNLVTIMIESLVSAAVAVITGGAVLTSRIHTRIMELDKRIDQVELGMAQAYVSKADFERTLERVEGHMIRIEDKLDKIAGKTSSIGTK